MFIDHVRQVVFVDKIITLQGLLHEYKVQNVASMLRDEIKKARKLPWFPRVRELEQEEDASPLLVFS